MRPIFAIFGLLMIGVLALFPPTGSTQDWTRKRDRSFRISTAQTSNETGLPIEVEFGPLIAVCIVALSLVVTLWFLVGSERRKPSDPAATPESSTTVAGMESWIEPAPALWEHDEATRATQVPRSARSQP